MTSDDPKHDFDFLVGRWHIKNKRLIKYLQGSNEWETFEATGTMSLILDGMGNIDDFTPKNWKPGFVGMSLRLLIPKHNNGVFTGQTMTEPFLIHL